MIEPSPRLQNILRDLRAYALELEVELKLARRRAQRRLTKLDMVAVDKAFKALHEAQQQREVA